MKSAPQCDYCSYSTAVVQIKVSVLLEYIDPYILSQNDA